MSYDVSLRVDTGNSSYLELLVGNYTYNCSNMLVLANDLVNGSARSLSSMSGWRASRVAEWLGGAVRHMRTHEDLYTPHEPTNGWGDLESWCAFLADIAEACRQHPKAYLYVG